MRKLSEKAMPLLLAAAVTVAFTGCDGMEFLPDTSDLIPVSQATSQTTAYQRQLFDGNVNPYFAMLNEIEKDAYSQIYEQVYDGNSTFDITVKINESTLSRVLDAVKNDHPELFWVDNTFSYTYSTDDGSICELTVDFYDFADTEEELAEAKSTFNTAAQPIISAALMYPTIVDRELYIHDYICENTDYDESVPYNQSAYSAIVLHKSVCAGYAKSVQYLLQKVGVTCYYVTGMTEGMGGQVMNGSEDDGRHSWNMVLIDGEFYNLDSLWDDTASDTYGSAIYPFFNLDDTNLKYHARIGLAVNLPACTGTEYKYSNKFGSTIEVENISFTSED